MNRTRFSCYLENESDSYLLLNILRRQIKNSLALYDTCIIDEDGGMTELPSYCQQ